jgi:hypothetical protein
MSGQVGDVGLALIQMPFLRLITAIVCLTFASPVVAEDVTVHLKSGEEMTGRLVEAAPDHVTVDFGRGKHTRFARTSVAKLDRNVSVSTDGPTRQAEDLDAVAAAQSARSARVFHLLLEQDDWRSRYTGRFAATSLLVLGAVALIAAPVLGYVVYPDSGHDSIERRCNPNGLQCEDFSTYGNLMTGFRTAAYVSGVAGALAVTTGVVLLLLRTSRTRQSRELERIDKELKSLGAQTSVTPWSFVTEKRGAAGGLQLTVTF